MDKHWCAQQNEIGILKCCFNKDFFTNKQNIPLYRSERIGNVW